VSPFLAAHFILLVQLPPGGLGKALNGPPVEKGWQAVTGVPLWPAANDPMAALFLKRPPNGPGVRYVVGGRVRLSTATSFGASDAERYEFRLVGWSKEGSTKVLGDGATNRRGELRGLIGIRVERRPRGARIRKP
jgi:hypothetical protein